MQYELLYFVGIPALLALSVLGLVRWLQRHERARRRRADQAAVDRAVKNGKLRPDGRPRCQAATCEEVASHKRIKIERQEGVGDLLRRRMGAAPRYVVGERFSGELHYCDIHFALAEQEAKLHLAELERLRLESVRDAEVNLDYFERVGLGQRLDKLVKEQYRAEQNAAGPTGGIVVPFRKAQ